MQIKDLLPFLFIPAVVLSASVRHEHYRSSGLSSSLEKRITGGNIAQDNEFTWAVSFFNNGTFHCNGALIDKNSVLTSVGCIPDDLSVLRLHYGTHKDKDKNLGFRSKALNVTLHPNYTESNFNNDVAIVKLASPVPDNSKIVYPKFLNAGSRPAPGSVVTLIGWGKTQFNGALSRDLKKVNLNVISQEDCAKYKVWDGHVFTEQQFCTSSDKSHGACQYDLGGPAVDKSGYLIGSMSDSYRCGDTGNPVIFANYVSKSIHDFIMQYLNQHKDN